LDLVQADRAQQGADGSAAGDAVGPEDARALAQAYEQAVQRGHAQGFAQGQAEGERAGYEAGLQTGVQAGRAEALQGARDELQSLGAPVTELKQQLQLLHADWEASLRKDLIDLVERVARQVVRCELTLQPAQILALVEETLQGMPQRTGEVQVYLNPVDLQRIQELDSTRVPDWKLQADSTLDAGECRLRVGEAEVDAGCKQRLGPAWNRCVSSCSQRSLVTTGMAAGSSIGLAQSLRSVQLDDVPVAQPAACMRPPDCCWRHGCGPAAGCPLPDRMAGWRLVAGPGRGLSRCRLLPDAAQAGHRPGNRGARDAGFERRQPGIGMGWLGRSSTAWQSRWMVWGA
jgi:flagellar assembly protein FliH